MTLPLHTRIADALARLGALTRHHENQQSQAEGLSPLQARALVILRRRARIRLGELAKELLVTEGTLSSAVSSLEEKGLVIKRADPDEHRAVNLELTRKGSAAARRAEGRAGEQVAPAVADLSDEEAAGLFALLLKLIRAFERRGAIAAARMCFTCRYFDPQGGSGARPYYCNLLEEPIGERDLRVECPDHEPAGPDQPGGASGTRSDRSRSPPVPPSFLNSSLLESKQIRTNRAHEDPVRRFVSGPRLVLGSGPPGHVVPLPSTSLPPNRSHAMHGYRLRNDEARSMLRPVSMKELRMSSRPPSCSPRTTSPRLRMSLEVLRPQVEDVLDVWYGFVGSTPHLLDRTSAIRSTGEPDGDYLAAVRASGSGSGSSTPPSAEYDEEWLAWQHEIGLRHHSTKKNRTDGGKGPSIVHFSHMVALTIPVTTTLRPFLEKGDHTPEEVDRMHQAWVKSVLLQTILWSHAYVNDGEF